MTTDNYISLTKFCYHTSSPCLNNPKDLDPSYTTDLDFLGYFGREKKICFITREVRYFFSYKMEAYAYKFSQISNQSFTISYKMVFSLPKLSLRLRSTLKTNLDLWSWVLEGKTFLTTEDKAVDSLESRQLVGGLWRLQADTGVWTVWQYLCKNMLYPLLVFLL